MARLYILVRICKPTIIVGELSKMFNIIRMLSPRIIFRPDLTEDEFDAFLNGKLNLAFLQQVVVVGIEEREWNDYEMPPTDYIHVTGIPVLQFYGPFERHVAIYIPKLDPYAPYHIQNLRTYMIEVDRYVRQTVELVNDITQEAAPIPFDETRKDHLVKLRLKIMKEAEDLGLRSLVNIAKENLAEANKGFAGPRSIATRARTAEEIAQGTGENSLSIVS